MRLHSANIAAEVVVTALGRRAIHLKRGLVSKLRAIRPVATLGTYMVASPSVCPGPDIFTPDGSCNTSEHDRSPKRWN